MKFVPIQRLALGLLLTVVVAGCGGAAPDQTPVSTAKPAVSPATVVTARSAAPPAIAFDTTARDFGKVEFGRIYQHTFKVTNQSGAPLVLEQVDLKALEGC